MVEFTIETRKTGFMGWWVDAYLGDELVAEQRRTPYATRRGAIRAMKRHLRRRYGASDDKTQRVFYHV